MTNNIFEDFISVMNNLTVSDADSFFDMMESLPEDQESIFRIRAVVLRKKQELELDEDGIMLVLAYHLGKLHGGNNVKT